MTRRVAVALFTLVWVVSTGASRSSSPCRRCRPMSGPLPRTSTRTTPRRSRCSSASSTSTAARRTSPASGRSALFRAESTPSVQDAVGRRRVVAARRPPRRDHPGRAAILLIGHLDTVFETDSPFQSSTVDEDREGPGHHRHEGRRRRHRPGAEGAERGRRARTTMNIIVVMTGDEEDPGGRCVRARDALVAPRKGAAAAMGFEDGDGDPRTPSSRGAAPRSWT